MHYMKQANSWSAMTLFCSAFRGRVHTVKVVLC